MTNIAHDVGCEPRDRPDEPTFAAPAYKIEEYELAEAKIVAAFEPYLDAALSGEPSGNPKFDREVTGIRDLAIFLAHRAIEVLLKRRT